MNDDTWLAADSGQKSDDSYHPPTITFLGTVADLTQKTVGAADGDTFLGIDIGSV